MSKFLLLYTLLAISISNSFSQSHKFDWAASIGGKDGGEIAYASVTDKSGNIYTTGLFVGKTDFDPSAGFFYLTAKNIDAYILKLDASGNFVWAQTIPSSFQAVGLSLVIDSLNNVYLSGSYRDSIMFDLGTSKLYSHSVVNNIFYSKLDSNGNFIWGKALNDNSSVSTYPSSDYSKIKVDHKGNLIISGIFEGRLDFNAGTDSFYLKSSCARGETFVLKTNNSGDFIWAKNFSGTRLSNESQSIGIDSKNNIFLCGNFDDTMDANPSLSTDLLVSKGDKDMYLVKLDSFGNHLWAKSFGNKRVDNGSALIVDQYDNVIMTGYFADTIDITTDTGIVKIFSSMSDAGITIKFDSVGKFKWAKKFQGFFGSCKPLDIKQDQNDNIYVLGNCNGSVDFDPGPDSFYVYSSGHRSFFITKLDSVGNFNNVKRFNSDFLYDLKPTLAIDANSNVFVSGTFSEKLDADPSIDSFILTSFDTDDFEVFIIKLISCNPSSRTDSIKICGSYTLADEKYTTSGVYKKNLINSTGCDSLVTLHLTILPKPIASITHVSANTLKCYNTGVHYQWVSCPTYSPIINDTNSVFNAPYRGYFAVIISNGLCSDTSECRIIEPLNILTTSKTSSNIILYPNPFTNTATLEFDNPQSRSHQLSVFNTLGQLVMSIGYIKSNKVLIDRKDLQSGLYFYQLRNDEGVVGSGKMMLE